MPSVGEVVDILSKIEEYLKRIKLQERIKEKVRIAKNYFRTDDGSVNLPNLEKVFSILKKIYDCLPQFTSRNPTKLLQGLTGIVASVSSITGIGGPVVPAICGVLSVIFSYFGGTTFNIGEVVEREIGRVFQGHNYETLLEEADDLHHTYQLAFDFLNPTGEKTHFSEHDITNMNIQMNVFQGATFLRKLGKLIKELAKEHSDDDSKRKSEKANKAIQFIELYTKLALLRDMILWHFYTITNSTAHSQHLAGGIQRVIASFDERDREALGMFLKPTKEYVYIVSCVSEEEDAQFMTFLELKKLVPDHSRLTYGQFGLYSAKWPHWHVIRRIKNASSIFPLGDLRFLRGTKSATRPESLFCFERIRKGKNYFYITQRGRSGERVTMTKGSDRWVMSLKGVPESDCSWKVIQMENGNYVFSPVCFPGYFMGMSNLLDGSIAGFLGGFNEQCQWILIS